MFIREHKTNNKKTGAVYLKHSLVESFRSDKGSRQRSIMQLGVLSLPKRQWPMLAAELERRLAGEAGSSSQLPLIAPDNDILDVADEAMDRYRFLQARKKERTERHGQRQLKTIDLDSATTSWSRTLGPELAAHHIWNELGFPEILKDCRFSARERSLAEAVVVGRLVSPGSDLATWRWIRAETAIAELTEVTLEQVAKDSVYEIADQLLQHKDAIEKHLLKRENELFPDRGSLYLFDLTNFYMEGQCLGNALAKYAKSKDKRNDCCLISLALMVDSEGFPIASRVYEGNVSEPSTLKEILADMGYLENHSQLELVDTKPTLAMDRGIATKENVAFLRSEGFSYIVIERSPRQKEYGDQFAAYEETFECLERPGHRDVWIRKVAGPDDETARVLCLSEGRKAKEEAIANRWEERARDDLKRLQNSIRKGTIKAIDKVNQRIGRLRERYPGFGKCFLVTVELSDDKKKARALTWEDKERETKDEETPPLYGCYVIETSHSELEAMDIWHLYMTLTRVEEAFRSLKSDLGARPVHHQLARRTGAHLFTALLAYHLLICIEYQLARFGDHRQWQTIRKVLRTHQRTTIIMTDEDDVIHHIRHCGQAEPCHRQIYTKLRIKNPLPRNHYEIARRWPAGSSDLNS